MGIQNQGELIWSVSGSQAIRSKLPMESMKKSIIETPAQVQECYSSTLRKHTSIKQECRAHPPSKIRDIIANKCYKSSPPEWQT